MSTTDTAPEAAHAATEVGQVDKQLPEDAAIAAMVCALLAIMGPLLLVHLVAWVWP